MSTRSLVARPCPDGGWEGRYVHSDGNPDFMVPVLIAAQRCRFAGDQDALAAHLLSHEGGWEYLGDELIDPTPDLASMFAELGEGSCYCHDWDGGAPEPLATDDDVRGTDHIEWIYVLRPEGLEVISTRRDRDDLRGPVLPWDTNLHQPISETAFHRWRPTTPPPTRLARPPRVAPPAPATAAQFISRKPAAR
ncbi:hypothetical protein [Streptacidiphilus fuscans]|uniref:Uncharacterized protein n=1 Tax=Streptacidiphilus fuscans TaxID=2789292 RepID=A0A931B7W2_9ACTN|nr:hypothetical protein [Streptacidiphilus fuscans]MBF9071756.1 hypothetical protein [Streptacidiphilus fuscans]